MISLLHPSRSRPEKSKQTLQKWIDRSVTNIEVITSIDENDPMRDDYYNNANEIFGANTHTVYFNNRSAVDAINNAATIATGDIFIVVSDDTDCPDKWDEKILGIVNGKTDWILKTQDGIQDWIITMPVMDRVYYNRFGYIYYPDYLHMFCDTELTCVADITERKITSNFLFPHRHYSVVNESPDAVNKKADSTWSQGERLFLERYKRNFDLPMGGKIQDSGMIKYLERKTKNTKV